MDTFLLQDWITIAGHEPVSIAQSAHQYVDIGRHEDLVFYLDVRECSGGVVASYETAPTRQDGAFFAMIAPITLVAGVRVDRVFFSTAAVPPARFVRWRLSASSANCTATFRVWVCAYAF